MLFNSIDFLVFFPIVTILFFIIPHKYRWALLLSASCVFYMFFKPVYIFILVFAIIIDYIAGIYLEKIKVHTQKRKFLIFSLIANISVLAVFKYYNFFNTNITGLAEIMGISNNIPFLDIVLPIGLSFHTFQAMSYTIEVYRGRQKAERHFGIYALYVMFYPQLVAGPIERPQNLIHQFYEKKEFSYDRIVSGLRLMLWGFFKKLVIADRLALIVNQVYNNPNQQNGLTFLIGTYLFAFQIYCDFSGYSDIARGAARVMGFELMINFNVPYLAKSISEFWSRWHISLSTWFKEYLYTSMVMPLRHLGKIAVIISIFLTFVISGLWHGANWNFIAWGALHGIYFVIGLLFFKNRLQNPNLLIRVFKIFCVFHLVLFSFIFFRADSLTSAIKISTTIFFDTNDSIMNYINNVPTFNGLGNYTIRDVLFDVFLILFLYILDIVRNKPSFIKVFNKTAWLRMMIYFFLLYSIIFFGYYGETAFIYFQF